MDAEAVSATALERSLLEDLASWHTASMHHAGRRCSLRWTALGKDAWMFTRRDFLKWTSSSAALLGLSQLQLFRLEKALAAGTSPPLIWLHGASCSGCSIAALNAVKPTTIADVLVSRVSAKYDALIMAGGSDVAIRALDAAGEAGGFVLVVEGGVPTAEGGRYCTIGERSSKLITLLDTIKVLGPKAARVVALGTCASYKGVPGAGANPAGVASVAQVLAGKTVEPVINVPGCPAPPEQLLAVVVALLSGQELRLDTGGRPTALYPHAVHFICERKHRERAKDLGEAGCMFDVGCRGPDTVALCPYHKWNNGANWCIAAGHPCIGCAMPDFPTTPLLKTGRYV
jgi:hydrogenase small subunit